MDHGRCAVVEAHTARHNFTTTDCMAPNLVTVAVTEDGGMMKITDPKLFKAIETAIASGNTVYLINPDYQSMGDGPELMRNSTLIKGRHGTFPADAFHTANSDQFLRVLKRYARFECEAYGRFCRDEYYMLRTELWQKVCRTNNMLCIGCVEDRLGRKLVPPDFNLEETLQSRHRGCHLSRARARIGRAPKPQPRLRSEVGST